MGRQQAVQETAGVRSKKCAVGGVDHLFNDPTEIFLRGRGGSSDYIGIIHINLDYSRAVTLSKTQF